MPDTSAAATHRFKVVLEEARGGGAGVMIPLEIAEAMGGRKQFRVIGTFNGVPLKSSTFPYWGEGLWLGVHKATREKAGAAFGDEVELEIRRDDAPRVVDLPRELERAFAADPALRERFEGLSFTRRREMAEAIAGAKKPETRASRLETALAALREV
jgi:hypothetical protein